MIFFKMIKSLHDSLGVMFNYFYHLYASIYPSLNIFKHFSHFTINNICLLERPI
jgi:hypothetical protein